jgi:hypothetical protein
MYTEPKTYSRIIPAPAAMAVATYRPSCQIPTVTLPGAFMYAAPLEVDAEALPEEPTAAAPATPVGELVTVPVPELPASFKSAEQVPLGLLEVRVDAAPLKSQADWALPLADCCS